MAESMWKMMIGPVLLLVLKLFKFQYDDPTNRLLLRILYMLTQMTMLLCCAYIAYKIKRGGDSTKTVQLRKATAAGEEGEVVSYQQYDFSELRSLSSKLLLGAGMTAFIHIYLGAVPPLLMQAVMQPMTFLEHPLFLIYVLHKNDDDDEKLKRPFPQKSPLTLPSQANASRLRNVVQSPPEDEHEEDPNGREESEEAQQDSEASVVTSDSRTTVSTTARRHRRRPSLQAEE